MFKRSTFHNNTHKRAEGLISILIGIIQVVQIKRKHWKERPAKPQFQTKTTTASANKMDIAITLYPTNTERGYHHDKT